MSVARAAHAAQMVTPGPWPGGYWWRPTGTTKRDVVDWGRSGPNQMLTLNALRVLRSAGRLA